MLNCQNQNIDSFNVSRPSHSSASLSLQPSVTDFQDRRMRLADLNNAAELKVECSGDCVIENVNKSDVTVIGDVMSLVVKNCTNLKLTVSCTGSISIFGCKSSILELLAHQIRIHDTSNTTFKVHCKTGCIVEDSDSLIFGPLSPDQTECTWKCVQDFTSFDERCYTYLE